MEPKYVWVPAKRRANRAKHRVDFTAMEAFEWDTAVIEADEDADEPRWIAKGFIGVVLYLVVYTERGNNIRIISLRKATKKEAIDYAQT